MKKSGELIIFLGFVLSAEFVGGVVYRTLINPYDNSRKEVPEGKINVDVAKEQSGLIIEEASGFGQIEIPEQGGIGQDVSSNEDGIDTSELPNIRGGGAVCTCVEQGAMDEEDGEAGSGSSKNDNQTENGEKEQSGDEAHIEDITDNSEMSGEAENVETTNSNSYDQEANIDKKAENGDQDSMDINGGSGVDEGILTLKFSSLDR